MRNSTNLKSYKHGTAIAPVEAVTDFGSRPFLKDRSDAVTGSPTRRFSSTGSLAGLALPARAFPTGGPLWPPVLFDRSGGECVPLFAKPTYVSDGISVSLMSELFTFL